MSELRDVKRELLFLLAYNRSGLRLFLVEHSKLGLWETDQLLKLEDPALLLEMQNWSLSHQPDQPSDQPPDKRPADLDFDFSDLDDVPTLDRGRHTRQTPYQPDEDDDFADLDPSKQDLS